MIQCFVHTMASFLALCVLSIRSLGWPPTIRRMAARPNEGRKGFLGSGRGPWYCRIRIPSRLDIWPGPREGVSTSGWILVWGGEGGVGAARVHVFVSVCEVGGCTYKICRRANCVQVLCVLHRFANVCVYMFNFACTSVCELCAYVLMA